MTGFEDSSTTSVCLEENYTIGKTGYMCARKSKIKFPNSQALSQTLSFYSMLNSGLLL